ncbi:MAG: hypothetical protein G5702_00765 [Serratia symbiotica]|nr:hypothetical protein [Serratia symbiotica]
MSHRPRCHQKTLVALLLSNDAQAYQHYRYQNDEDQPAGRHYSTYLPVGLQIGSQPTFSSGSTFNWDNASSSAKFPGIWCQMAWNLRHIHQRPPGV